MAGVAAVVLPPFRGPQLRVGQVEFILACPSCHWMLVWRRQVLSETKLNREWLANLQTCKRTRDSRLSVWSSDGCGDPQTSWQAATALIQSRVAAESWLISDIYDCNAKNHHPARNALWDRRDGTILLTWETCQRGLL